VQQIVQQIDASDFVKPSASGNQTAGQYALGVYALLHANELVDDERIDPSSDAMRARLDRLKALPMSGSLATYERSVRLNALALARRTQDRSVMDADLNWLIKSAVGGAYTYAMPADKTQYEGMGWDNSNTQYGALGVWAAAEAGLPVPPGYWADVQKHWAGVQQPDGGWAYGRSGSSSAAMTAAGVTTLFLSLQQPGVYLAGSAAPAKPAVAEQLNRGIGWLDAGDNGYGATVIGNGYALYGIERAGLASGYRYLGQRDWYRALAPGVLATQAKDGTWSGPYGSLVETCFRVLFLARGSHPILMSKLRWDGAWANRPDDLSSLTRYASTSLERPMNWQVVPVDQDWKNWTGSPVVYLATWNPPQFGEPELEKLRSFVRYGGILFTHADRGTAAVNKWVADELAPKLFPDLKYGPLPPDHVIYRVFTRLDPPPPLMGVSNGSRLLLVHSPGDLAGAWRRRSESVDEKAMAVGLNVAVYATGKAPFKNRLQSVYVNAPPGELIGTLPVARVTYAGRWDVEPAAWDNYARWFQAQTSIGLKVDTVDATKLDALAHPLAHLTGNEPPKLSAEELAGLKAYVENGGVLLIDACGGNRAFAAAAEKDILIAGFGTASQRPLRPGDLVVRTSDPATTLPAIEVWPGEGAQPEEPAALVPQVRAVGKGFIVFADKDLTTALLGASVWDIDGYSTGYARNLVKSLLLSASERAAQ